MDTAVECRYFQETSTCTLSEAVFVETPDELWALRRTESGDVAEEELTSN